ncbi:MAG TPA: hypothetical protein VHA56_11820 [Mucilaginibacter sp.]|nr:hypothetical protein [Mucilaginibacter sp.]
MTEKINIDIIILSYAKSDELKQTTIDTINTLIESENPDKISFNILVIESNKNLKPYQFEHTTTLYTDVPFGYNRYMNIGIKATSNPYVCLCNNDLIFHRGWASAILEQMALDADLLSVNPYCEIAHSATIPADGSNIISTIPGILVGWCLFFKREMLKVTGYFDERFIFWYADNDYGNTMEKHRIKHALVTSSKVTHIGSQSHFILNDAERFEYTYGQYLYYDLKWIGKNPLSYFFKRSLLPVFRYLFMGRDHSKTRRFGFRALARLYGGIK